MKFTFELVRYLNPRRSRERVQVHSDKLRSWGGVRSVPKYLNYLDEKNIIKRGSGYLVGKQSKAIKSNWKYKEDKTAIKYSGRCVESLEKAVSTIYTPDDIRAILGRYVKRTTALMTTKKLFK